jgi:hypothetical protein
MAGLFDSKRGDGWGASVELVELAGSALHPDEAS